MKFVRKPIDVTFRGNRALCRDGNGKQWEMDRKEFDGIYEPAEVSESPKKNTSAASVRDTSSGLSESKEEE